MSNVTYILEENNIPYKVKTKYKNILSNIFISSFAGMPSNIEIKYTIFVKKDYKEYACSLCNSQLQAIRREY